MSSFSTSNPPTPAMFNLAATRTFNPPIAAGDWTVELDAAGESGAGLGNVVTGLDDIGQCIGVILTTPQGSDPLRPTFACDIWALVDKPLTVVRTAIVQKVIAALTLWEPRISVLSVTVAAVPSAPGQVIITIAWQLKLAAGGAPQTTTVTIGRTIAGAVLGR
jgi:phage baseplate assembly protein W